MGHKKLKILYLAKFLQEQTDEDHPATVNDMIRYLNQYEAADEVSKDIAKRLINLEEKLTVDIRQYL